MASVNINDKVCVIHDSKRAEAMAANATVFCGQCGAEAHDPRVVCQPIPITKQGDTKR